MAGNRALSMNFPSLPSDWRRVLFLFRLKLQRMNVRGENWSVKAANLQGEHPTEMVDSWGCSAWRQMLPTSLLMLHSCPPSKNMKQMINTFPGSSMESFSVFFFTVNTIFGNDQQFAIENGHRKSWFSHEKCWFSIVMLVYHCKSGIFDVQVPQNHGGRPTALQWLFHVFTQHLQPGCRAHGDRKWVQCVGLLLTVS